MLPGIPDACRRLLLRLEKRGGGRRLLNGGGGLGLGGPLIGAGLNRVSGLGLPASLVSVGDPIPVRDGKNDDMVLIMLSASVSASSSSIMYWHIISSRHWYWSNSLIDPNTLSIEPMMLAWGPSLGTKSAVVPAVELAELDPAVPGFWTIILYKEWTN